MLYSFDQQQIDRLEAVIEESDVSNEELMDRIKTGDETALASMYQRHGALLRTVIARIVNNDQDVDDLVQEVALEIWRQAAHYDVEKGKALGWIVTLARRRAIDRVRKKQAYYRAQERYRLEVDHLPEHLNHHGADSEATLGETSEMFSKVLANLPDAQREALHMAYYKGLSQREISAQTGIPLGTIKTRLELALRKVRTSILAMGGAREWMPSMVAG